MPWNLQKINDGGVSSGPGAVGDTGHESFVCAYGGQQHFAYLDANGNIQDAWYDATGGWHLQQINNANGHGPTVAGEYVASPAATAPAVGDLFVCVYGGQQHFTYRDASGNIQDVFFDGSNWHSQQINNANGHGPTVAGEYVASPAATAPAVGDLFVCVYGGQQHFAYLDASGNIQDAWFDGSNWHLQQINNANGRGPTVAGEYVASSAATAPAVGDLFVCVYGGQQHFAYRDASGNIQDVFFDGSNWHSQQINNANGHGPTVAGEYVASSAATAPAVGDLFVCVYGGQQHFAYRDASGNIQDVFFDGSNWHSQQINNANGHGPTVAGEYVASSAATAPAVGDLFVCVYGGQQHFAYRDASGNIQDAFFDGSKWNLQQINNANGRGPAVAGEYVASPAAPAAGEGNLFVCVYDDGQHPTGQHFAYRGAGSGSGDVWDCWWSAPTPSDLTVTPTSIIYKHSLDLGADIGNIAGPISLTITSDGSYNFSGQLNNSGKAPYTVNVVSIHGVP